jgi:hypothetical protein
VGNAYGMAIALLPAEARLSTMTGNERPLAPPTEQLLRGLRQGPRCLAIDGGKWEIYLGSAAGDSVRKGGLLSTVRTHDEAPRFMGRFMESYREYGKYLERSYHFVERIGIETLRRILVDVSLSLCAQLDVDIQKAVDAYSDPWKEAEVPRYPQQFRPSELAAALEVAENNG